MSEIRSAKPVRLRLACDACTTAKVRCSRTHPCERCEDNGQAKECCYSASRRHGKRARHRKNAQDSSLTTQFTNAWEDYSTYSAGDLEMLDSWASRSVDVTVDFDDGNGISWVDPWKSLGFVSDTTASQSSGMVSPGLSLSMEPILSIKAPEPTAMHSHDSRYHTDGVELRPMKIQLGMLDLDDEDQATLQRTVVLRELRKAEKVMETFDSFAGGDDGGLNWHAVAVTNMREELQEIIQKI
ncbi:fusarubin cluster-transcription factor [Fusarium oxysporum]|nr:fusarubin cluster-transcription factor [Fusarium oxysporum]